MMKQTFKAIFEEHQRARLEFLYNLKRLVHQAHRDHYALTSYGLDIPPLDLPVDFWDDNE